MTVSSDKVRVILIEDHNIVREGLKLILHGTPDLEVIGEATNGQDGVRLFTRVIDDGGVDVVVTDLGLPDISGLEVMRRIKALQPGACVLMLTMYADDEHIRGMLELGANGYLLKQSAPRDLCEAIRTVARGETALSPAIARRLITQVQRDRERDRRAGLLTERERQILGLLAEGCTSKEVAQRLGLSTKTVENHRARILVKLGVVNTAAAISQGSQLGLLAKSDHS